MEGNHRYYLQPTGDFGWPLMVMITGQRVFADCGFLAFVVWYPLVLQGCLPFLIFVECAMPKTA